MARTDALLRLHKSLSARRDELRQRLGGELKDLANFRSGDTGDAADLAFDSGSEEVSSQIAELESRELNQVDRALTQLKRGSYGICEGCGKKIPVSRLSALPFSTTCILCQREMELHGSYGDHPGKLDWTKVSDAQVSFDEPREVDLSQMEVDFSSSR